MDVERFDVDRLVTHLDVDLGTVGTRADRPLAVSGYAAGKVLAADAAGGFAARDDTQIFAHDTADGDQSGHGAGEAAARHGAAAGADDAAHAALTAVGRDRTGNLQIHDPSALFQIAEQALVRAVGAAGKVFDRMAVAEEGAGEGGNGHDGAPAEVDIPGQIHTQADRPGAAAAVEGKVPELLGGGDRDDLALVLAGRAVGVADDKLAIGGGRFFDGLFLLGRSGIIRKGGRGKK